MGVLKALRQRLNKARSTKRENPSIADFQDAMTTNPSKLVAAMGGGGGGSVRGGGGGSGGKLSRRSSDSSKCSELSMSSYGGGSGSSSEFEANTVEWTLPLVDVEASEPQSMEEEIKRLKALNDYFVLDSEGEIEFDRLTRLASQIFDVPIALISLVDLGRQWFLSKVGLDAVETPRKHAFCAHVIINKYKLLVVPDATKDIRFQDNPLVKESKIVCFYAGAALVSAEGYKLGTLCIISPQPRPEGLSTAQQEMLHEMAAMVVSAMAARRDRILKEDYESRFHDVGKILMDTSKSMESSKEVLQEMVAQKTDPQAATQKLSSMARSLGLQSKICTATMRNILLDKYGSSTNKSNYDDDEGSQASDFDILAAEYDKLINPPTTDMVKVFENLNALIPTFPFHGTVSVDIDKSVPKEIIAEDLLLFRSIFNMLTHCMGRSSDSLAPDLNKTGIRIRRMKRQGNELLVQCLQPGPTIDSVRAKELFQHKESLLGPVASMVRSLGGRFGMFEGKWDHQNGKTAHTVQSIFWFQIPYELPAFVMQDPNDNKLRANLHKTHEATKASMTKNSIDNKTELDPFQAALMEAGCGGRGR